MAAVAQPTPRNDHLGLGTDDFRLICESGFGDGHNGYAHSIAWFEGRLYIGTTRATFTMLKVNLPRPDWKPWPVESPDDREAIDRRAEIWCYDPAAQSWTMLFKAPWVEGKQGGRVPRYVGLRGMVVFQGASDAKPCLYVSTWSPITTDPPDILRCENGTDFIAVPRPPWDESVRSFRTLQPFRGRVHTTPTGSNTGDGQAQECIGSESTIYASSDVQNAIWEPASADGFGDPSNTTVFEMATFNGQLYAGTVNPDRGMEVWRTDGDSDTLPYRWKRVLSHGAWRGKHNELCLSMCEFKGALYIGTAIVNGGYHRRFQIGPAAAELLRIWPDDSWDLLVGHSRLTPDGLRYPLSGYAPGFDNMFGGYIWRMAEHAGHLYIGTYCWINMLPYFPRHAWPSDVLTLLRRLGPEELNRLYGGCDLWRTADGVHFEPVTRSGFGNKYNWGIRNFASSPHGLFVATSNVFGPRLAVERNAQWRYEDNPRGGLEVYLGQRP